MRKIFVILIFFTLFLPAQAINTVKEQMKDSMLRLYMTSAVDTVRMRLLNRISMLEPQSPTYIYYQNKILNEAIAQKNIKYQSLSIYRHILYYYNQLDEKHTEQWTQQLEDFAHKNNYYVDYCKGKKLLIELYTTNHKVELAINEALNMFNLAQKLNNRAGMREAHLCLLSGYVETMRYKEGLKSLHEAFKLILPSDSSSDKLVIYSKAILIYSTLHDNEKLYEALVEAEKATNDVLRRHNATSNNTLPELSLFIEMYYAQYYTRKGEAEKALPHLKEAERHNQQSLYVPYKVTYMATCAEYYRLIKEYDKSLECWSAAIEQITPFSSKDAMTYSIQKADLLVEMEKSEDALPLYKKIIRTKDSLYNDLATSQMEEIQSLYNIDKLILQQEQRRSIYHYIYLSISVIIIIALILFNAHIYRSRKRLQKDEKEMRKLATIAEEANDMKSRFLANMSYNIRIPLNNVVGFSQLMTEDHKLSEPEKKEYTSIIQNNSTELIQLVNDVLDLSRLEANMMKFQLQDYNLQEWCNDLEYIVQMRSEGNISLRLHAEAGDAVIHTDINRFTQIISSMLTYPVECKEAREIQMELIYYPDMKEIAGRIENSPLADPAFASQKVTIRQEINGLFFEHFNGTYRMEKSRKGVPLLYFTYPTLTP